MWTLDASDGELVLRTGVVGRAARLGHRLTIAMTRWQALVNWSGTDPVAGELVAEVDSFEVMRGEGGVKGLSEPEKALVRANALKTLNASRFPHIRFTTEAIAQTGNGYRLTGKLHIRGKCENTSSTCTQRILVLRGASLPTPRFASPTTASNPTRC